MKNASRRFSTTWVTALTLLAMAPISSPAESSQPLTPQDFGASCDGATDDTQSFANALAATKYLFIPPGVCRVATIDVPSGAHLIGVSGRSVIQITTNSNANLLDVRFADNAHIENLTWEAQGQSLLNAPQQALIYVGQSHGVTFTNNIVRGGTGQATAILVFDSSAHISDNDISGFGNQVRIDSTLPVSITHNRLHDNVTDGSSGGNGITIRQSEPSLSPTVIDGNWLANHVAVPGSDGPSGNSISGFRVNGVRVMNNYAANPEFSCFRFNDSANMTATGNQCYNAGATGGYSEFSSVHNQWVNNYFENSAGNCLGVTNFSSTPPGQMHSAIGNHMRGCGRSGIKAEGRSIVADNIINHAKYGISMGFGGTGRDVLVTGNLTTDTDQSPIMQVGIAIEPNDGGFVVEGNSIVPSASLVTPIGSTNLSVTNQVRPLRPDDTIKDQMLTFTNLGSPAAGSSVYCPDCGVGGQGQCQGNGSGAFARRLPGIWVCD